MKGSENWWSSSKKNRFSALFENNGSDPESTEVTGVDDDTDHKVTGGDGDTNQTKVQVMVIKKLQPIKFRRSTYCFCCKI